MSWVKLFAVGVLSALCGLILTFVLILLETNDVLTVLPSVFVLFGVLTILWTIALVYEASMEEK